MTFTFTDTTKHSFTDESIEEGPFHIPIDLAETEQWITFKLEEGDDGKMKKKPHSTRVTQGKYGPYVKYSGVRTEENFTDYMSAINFVKETNKRDDLEGLDGVGFVFTEDDDYLGIDLDDVVNSRNEIKNFANTFLGSVDSFAESSPSGTGIHIIAKGSVDDSYYQKDDDLGAEIYDKGRFFTVTGNRIKGASKSINEASGSIKEVQHEYFDERPAESNASSEWTSFSIEDTGDSDVSDSSVVKTAKSYSDKFARLYEGGSSHGNDASRDDLAFCRQLSFWTGEDAAQMKRIWLNSGRAREKLSRDDYVSETIRTAIRTNDDTYSGRYK